MSEYTAVPCTFERHAPAILDILNDAIVNSTALYDYKPRQMQNMVSWFEVKRAGNFPVIGIEDAQGTLLAFGSYGTFRAFPAYKYTVEHSVYVHKDHRGHGLGAQVMQALIAAARENQLHVLMGAIDASNAGIGNNTCDCSHLYIRLNRSDRLNHQSRWSHQHTAGRRQHFDRRRRQWPNQSRHD